MKLQILYEDSDVIAVNKPQGIASIHDRRAKDCLLSLISTQFNHKLYVVHRLDREVSGVILFAINPSAHKYLNIHFNNRLVQKVFLALTHGILQQHCGVIEKPLR